MRDIAAIFFTIFGLEDGLRRCYYSVRMGMTNLTVILAALAIAWLPSSCSKSHNSNAAHMKAAQAAQAAPKAEAENVSASANTPDSRELSLTNNSETRIQLGADKSCRIKPVVLDGGNLQLTLALEIRKAGGKLQGLIITQVVTPAGQPFEIVMSTTDIAFTPVIVE